MLLFCCNFTGMLFVEISELEGFVFKIRTRKAVFCKFCIQIWNFHFTFFGKAVTFDFIFDPATLSNFRLMVIPQHPLRFSCKTSIDSMQISIFQIFNIVLALLSLMKQFMFSVSILKIIVVSIVFSSKVNIITILRFLCSKYYK